MTASDHLDVVHVVVPAHNEGQRIGACLESLREAVSVLAEARPAVVARTTVVLDRCTDTTSQRAREAGVTTITVDAACVGTARRMGALEVARQAGSTPASRVWLAMTDADCIVPATWLVDQTSLAEKVGLVVGRVVPDETELSGNALDEWHRRHLSGRHVHGANLGVRLDAYLHVGGFADLEEHEDVVLVAALSAAGVRLAHGSWVTTSARRDGRTPGGFAAYLRDLDADLAG